MKVKNHEGEVFNAVQFVKGQPLPESVMLVPKAELLEKFAPKHIEDQNRDRHGVATKDNEAPLSNIGDGTWILHAKSGEVSLCHPIMFEREYTKIED